jgi:hypothetical protein
LITLPHDGGPSLAVCVKIVNISEGGACVLAERAIEPFSVVPCRFRFPGVPVPVPVLMQVRWVETIERPATLYRLGLSFLS